MKRLWLSILTGSILGVFCIIGVSSRIPIVGNELFFLGMWFNRVVMGLLIAFVDRVKLNPFFRGGLFGLIISSAFFLSTSFRDIPGFIAGIVYGVIIDYISSRWGK